MDLVDWSAVAYSINFWKTTSAHFVTLFGVTTTICSLLWKWILPHRDQILPKHLLYCLYYLKCYPLQHEVESLLHIDHKTFFKWVWIVVDRLYETLDMVWYTLHADCTKCALQDTLGKPLWWLVFPGTILYSGHNVISDCGTFRLPLDVLLA